MGEKLSIRLFGALQVMVDGAPLPRLRSRKGLHLLALLALRAGGAVERDYLIATLWPESDEAAGRESLKKTLADLRAALGPQADRIRSVGRGQLSLDLAAGGFCDVASFDGAISRFEKFGDRASAEEAAGLYRGPFLEGVLDDWAIAERGVREQSALPVFEALARLARSEGEATRALIFLRRAEKLDPLRESIQREILLALSATGETAAVRRAFREWRLRLHSELRQEPDPETATLYRRLTDARPEPPAALEAGGGFPRFATPLLGRESDLETVAAKLVPGALVTLVGIGGMGKTRLATAVARSRPRAAFVDLALLPNGAEEEAVGLALAHALGPSVELAKLRALLAADDALIVLDNCEHVLDGVRAALRRYLPDDPTVCILATSREPLGLRGERVVALETLSPAAAATLFRERAEEAGARLDGVSEALVGKIVARLDGLPLAIELAAARAGTLPLAELSRRLDEPLSLLAGRHPDLPPRQRTMRAALDGSWDSLSDVERETCAALSVFVAPFSSDDARAVAGDDGSEALLALHSRSLLVSRPGGWTFLQPVLAYVSERLAADPSREREARRRHAERFAQLGERESARRHSGGSDQAFRRLLATRLDRASACAWAAAHDPALFLQLALVQAPFLRQLRHTEDALALIAVAESIAPPDDVRARLRLEAALCRETGRREALADASRLATTSPTRGAALYERAVLEDDARNRPEARQLYAEAAETFLACGNLERAASAAARLERASSPEADSGEQALLADLLRRIARSGEAAAARARVAGDREAESSAHAALASVAGARGEKDAALRHAERIAALWREAGDDERTADALRTLGQQFVQQGRRADAVRAYEEGFALNDSLVDADERALSRCRAARSTGIVGWYGIMRRFLEPCEVLLAACSPTTVAPVCHYFSIALHFTGSSVQSLEYMRRCREIRFQMGDEQEWHLAERVMALALLDLERHNEADALLSRLGEIYRERGQNGLLCEILTSRTRLERQRGNLTLATKALAEADALFPDAGSYQWDKRRLEAGLLYRALGEREAARRELESLLARQEPQGMAYVTFFTRLTLAWLDLDDGRFPEAASTFSAVCDEALLDENRLIAAEATEGLARTALATGNREDTLAHAQRAAALYAILELPAGARLASDFGI